MTMFRHAAGSTTQHLNRSTPEQAYSTGGARALAEKRSGPENFRLVEALQRVMDEVAVDARPQTDLFALPDVHSDALLCGKVTKRWVLACTPCLQSPKYYKSREKITKHGCERRQRQELAIELKTHVAVAFRIICPAFADFHEQK